MQTIDAGPIGAIVVVILAAIGLVVWWSRRGT
jgi:hypothetical protein